MILPLSFLLVGWGSDLDAQGIDLRSDETEKKDPKGLPAMEMLVKGSILQKIIIPQYDEQLRLSSVMRADKLILVDDSVIDAESVKIEFYHTDQTLRGGISLQSARLHDQRILRSSEPVTLSSGDLTANGTGLVYFVDTSRGFLFGPASAKTLIEPTTSMNTIPLRLSAAGISLMAAAAIHAEGLEKLTEQQLTGLDRLAVSQAPAAAAAADEATAKIVEADNAGAKADETLSDFLTEAAIKIKDGPKPDLTSEVAAPDIDNKIKLPASIKATQGIYFDSVEGLLVFLDSVEIDHPEFSLTGADEVKVFMEKAETPAKPPEKKVPENEEKKEAFGAAKFGDPTRIVATGQVVVEKKKLKPSDKGAKASGRQMLMDLKSNELIIRGGQPWVMSDTANGRVIDPNGYIRINLKTGDASFVGDSRGFVEMKQK